MKAITVKYHGPTATRCSRVIATAEGGHRLALKLGLSEETTERSMDRAAIMLSLKLQWSGPLVSGGLNKSGDMVYCFDRSKVPTFDDIPHAPIGNGQCWVCGHYGDDCTGRRANQ